MIIKDIAEYEDKDSELAKFTISQLHCKIQELESQNKELARLNIEKIDTILKATEYINKFDDIIAYYEYIDEDGYDEYFAEDFKKDILDILKGVDKE